MNPNNNKPEQQKMLDNRAEQLNPTCEKYWLARGFKQRPKNWQKQIVEHKKTN
ncbi:MAG: hypothetical protein RL264_580 [Bacteroidota bacterium]|jgi:hypothetical protein